MKRTTAVRVICIVLALIFVLSLLTVIIPARVSTNDFSRSLLE